MDTEALLEQLTDYHGDRVWNQYGDVHRDLDLPDGAQVRCANLRAYLEAFNDARFILVGEAAGYAGCRFSGIPFTCENQLVGENPLAWTKDLSLDRSSRADKLWVERSATMVWQALAERRDVLLWNVFPWHPYGARGLLSNRHPGRHLDAGLEVLLSLLSLFPEAMPYAVGRVAERGLADLGLPSPYIRHPSHGGKTKFDAGVAALLQV